MVKLISENHDCNSVFYETIVQLFLYFDHFSHHRGDIFSFYFFNLVCIIFIICV